MVEDGANSHKLEYATIFKEILNLKGLPKSKVTTILLKGPAIKKFMPLVEIIEAHDAFRNFWIW